MTPLVEEICTTMKELLNCLPDNYHYEDDETWQWCWNELSCEAQELVINVRRTATELLKKYDLHEMRQDDL